ncbi:hypothetical protein ALI144C_37580 [Actinosynnema sp. ALI-1.44]|uniref:SRPBCC domain-containing protein n=1 Tax=Actinosynnema sp. ALI-1.44 TaxID=1933779 RepID=UPI00097C0D45|nr:SRPBCC domain-containing protein [Actinosynnema sp. ALI-1.44]ONI76363.1 hypothetical protein ALI144C_37580 [Actinosynnema sp. ALI-1.44]
MVPHQIELDIDIAATPENVWAALTETEHIRVWWAFGGAEVDLRPGGAMVFRWEEHGEYHSVIETVEPAKRFTFRMSATPGEQPGPRNETLVDFTLSATANGTHLRFTESGFPELNGTDEEKQQHAEISEQGWTGGLDTLKGIAEKLD